MKKTALSILAVVLLLTLVCGTALASTGDITIKAAKAYADPDFKYYIGTIPKYTAVQVRAYGSYADVVVNGVECFVKPSTLTQGARDNDYIGSATVPKGTRIYQRPSTSAKFTTASKNRTVKVYAVSRGYALIRNKKGMFGFVKADALKGLKG